MKKRPPVRDDVPWTKRQEIPDPQILDAADQYEQARIVLVAQPSGVLLPLINVASMAVELYLKALSAEMIHVKDELMPEVSRVYAASAITSSQGHGLVGLLNAMPDDVRAALLAAFDAELKPIWRTDLQSVLQGLEGVFMSSRYPFEHGIDITQCNLGHLAGLAGFLAHFVRTFPATDRIAWKRGDITTRCT
ncbi:MAG: hypothetical protein HYR55_13530 [Acidobacteria bacterium]|nr:hypothetical protein [Acidobacteriota bacterium]